MKRLLKHPAIYQLYQEVGGFFGTRIAVIRNHLALRPGGALFTLDGCYAPGQSRIAKWRLDNDRGVHVRDAQSCRRLLRQAFAHVEMHVRDDYSRVPYTFAIGVARGGCAAPA